MSGVLLIAAVFVNAIVPSGAVLFQTTSPIVWTLSSKYVSLGTENLLYDLVIMSPCEILSRFKPRKPEQLRQLQPQQFAALQTANLVPHGLKPLLVQPAQFQPAPQPPLAPTTTSNDDDDDESEPIRKKRQIIRDETDIALEYCERVFKAKVIEKFSKFNFNKTGQYRSKRQLQFIAGFILSNIISFVKPDQTELVNGQRYIVHHLKTLNERINIQDLIQKSTLAAMSGLNHNLHLLDQSVRRDTHLSIVLSYMIAEMESMSALLDRLYYGMAEDTPDLVTVAQLFKLSKFDKIAAQDSQITSLVSPAPNSLRIGIFGRIRSTDTLVYDVHSFDFYSNWSETPVLNQFLGKKEIIKNQTANCVRGVESEASSFVELSCAVKDYRDPLLRLWRKTVQQDAKRTQLQSKQIVAYPFINVLCWTNNITIIKPNSSRETTFNCPIEPIAINASFSFHTSDGYVNHLGGDVKKLKFAPLVEVDVDDTHFENSSPYNNEIEVNLKRIEELEKVSKNVSDKLQEVENLGQIVQVQGYSFSWKNATLALLGVLMFFCLCGYLPRYTKTFLNNSLGQFTPAFFQTQPNTNIQMTRFDSDDLQTAIERALVASRSRSRSAPSVQSRPV